jgi:hypothetical protein
VRPRPPTAAHLTGDRGFESCSLQRRVNCKPDFLDQGTAIEAKRNSNELEIAERVLTRFGGKVDTPKERRTGRPARTAPAAAAGQRRARGGQQAPSVSLSDATLKAVQAHGAGATANEVLNYLSREFRMTVRPNHLGIALQRHRRAGRLESRDQRWYLPASA